MRVRAYVYVCLEPFLVLTPQLVKVTLERESRDRAIGARLVDTGTKEVGLMIARVSEGGVPSEWNARNPSSSVAPGDSILELNGLTAAWAIMEEMGKAVIHSHCGDHGSCGAHVRHGQGAPDLFCHAAQGYSRNHRGHWNGVGFIVGAFRATLGAHLGHLGTIRAPLMPIGSERARSQKNADSRR